jgi:hypothetical protein
MDKTTKTVPAKRRSGAAIIFALLSAGAVIAFWVLNFLKNVLGAILWDTSFAGFLRGMLSPTYLIGLLQTGTLVLSFLVLALLLTVKARGVLLLFFPVLWIFSVVLGVTASLSTLIAPQVSFVSVLFWIAGLLPVAALLLGNLLFALIVFANRRKGARALAPLAYVCPAVFAIGYLFQILVSVAAWVVNLLSYIENLDILEKAGRSIHFFVSNLVDFLTLSAIVSLILVTLTVFFACKWIVNPYKKGKEPIEEAPAEVIEEAAAEPSAKA